MTLLEIITLSRNQVDEATAALFTTADVLVWVNAAQRDIAAKSGCIEAVTVHSTVANSRFVTLTSGDKVNHVEYVDDAGTILAMGGSEIIFKDVEDDYLKFINDGIYSYNAYNISVPYPDYLPTRITPHHLGHVTLRDSNAPQYWFQWGNSIVIEPTPTAIYTLNVYTSGYPLTVLATDSEVPEIPTEFHDLIPLYVVMMCKLKQKYFQDAAMKYAEYIANLQLAINKYSRKSALRMSDIRLPDSKVGR